MKKEAEDDFKMVVTLDSIPENYSCVQYAHFYLGNKEKAIEYMEQILKNEDSDGNNYDATCLYSLMGNYEKAIYYLRRAFEKGYRKFSHIRADRDLNNIRNLGSSCLEFLYVNISCVSCYIEYAKIGCLLARTCP